MSRMDIKFTYNDERVLIRPSGNMFNLQVGDHYAGYLYYTEVSCRVVPDRLSLDIIRVIAKHLEKWEEQTSHIHIDTHKRVRDGLRATFRNYTRPGYIW